MDASILHEWLALTGVCVTVLAGSTIPAWLSHRKIVHEMRPNSGASFRDAIDRIEKTVNSHHAEYVANCRNQEARLAALENRKWWAR